MLPHTFGMLPVPRAIKNVIERYWWDRLRHPGTIRSLLNLVYKHPSMLDEATIERIVEVRVRGGGRGQGSWICV